MAKEELVQEIFELVGLSIVSSKIVDASFESLLRKIPELSEEGKEEIRRMYRKAIPLYTKELAPIYTDYFAEEELKELIAFYKTPLGRKMVEFMPILLVRQKEIIDAVLSGISNESMYKFLH